MPALWQDLPAMLDDVGRALAAIDPDFSQFLSEARLTVTGAAQLALQELLVDVEAQLERGFDGQDFDGRGLDGQHFDGRGFGAADGERPAGRSADSRSGSDLALSLFERAGRDEFRRGRPLRSLLLAYQTGGHVAWRHMAAVAMGQGVPAEALAALAEGVFRAVDQVSTVTVTGYLAEQAESAGMREQLRTVLAEQLLTEGADWAGVEKLARQARWPLPGEAAVVQVRAEEPAGPAVLARLSPGSLQARYRDLPAAIVPNPGAPGARHRLRALLHDCPAVVGPAMPLSRLAESAAVGRDALWLLDLPQGEAPPLFADEHLDTILVHRDERLLDTLRTRCLPPLEGAARGSRQALRETLRSWLVHMGDRQAVAAELQVHPQTVRYRVNRLRELFGPALEDPRQRLQLLLALGWDQPAPDGVRAPRGPLPAAGGERPVSAVRPSGAEVRPPRARTAMRPPGGSAGALVRPVDTRKRA